MVIISILEIKFIYKPNELQVSPDLTVYWSAEYCEQDT